MDRKSKIFAFSPFPIIRLKDEGGSSYESIDGRISEETKIRCIKDPLCSWSWFEDDCFCERNPCDTLYCYPDQNKSDEICACSMLLCDWNGTADGCYKFKATDGKMVCLCKDSFSYALYHPPRSRGPCNPNEKDCKPPFEMEFGTEDFNETLDQLNTTPEIEFLLKKLKFSMSDDAKDVERFYVPSTSVLNNYGMPFDNMILSCHYGPYDCDLDFATLYSSTYGKCYMFNYIGDGSDKNRTVKMATQAGRDHGLILYMQARKQDSLPLLTRNLGLRIYIHNPRSIPTLTEESIDVRPGDLTSIDISYREIHRLGNPWGECVSTENALDNNNTGLHYSQAECERRCINMEIYKRCKCYHPYLIPATLTPDRGPICNTSTTEDVQFLDRCFISVVTANDRGEITCDCPPACKEYQYDLINSASRLNPDFFRLLKKAKTLSTKGGKPSVINSDAEFSLIGVQIFYNSFFVTHVNETAIYSHSVAIKRNFFQWESLIANIGGNMGLFLGLSIVTILEVLEFFTEMITKLITGKRDSTRNKAIVINF
nr:acid-sensing ion channel 4-A-like [Parasteatoda tepidariorum]